MAQRILILTLLLGIFLGLSAATAGSSEQNFFDPQPYKIKSGDSLYNIATRFDLGLNEILRTNPDISDPHKIYVGSTITLPLTHIFPDTKLEGIVINLAEPRLYFFSQNGPDSFPISVGADAKTPIGKTKIIDKRENPTWSPPASIREEDPNLPEIVPAGPDNPLGNYALYLDASRNSKWQSIMIHGTNAPRSIGGKVSHGCIRLYPQDIEKLFNQIEIGTPVTIVNQPAKVLEVNKKIYLEIHLDQNPELVTEGLGVAKIICDKVEDCESRVDWQKVDDAVTQNFGIPVDITNDLLNYN